MKILHLSDIHFGRNYECYGITDKFDDKEKILDELIECIKNLHGPRPEHIVVTGDIVWGGKKSEYDEAYMWFSKLLDATGLTGKDITFCVGNHDVNRSYANTYIDYNNSSVEEIDEMYDYDRVHELEAPIYNYDQFCERLGVEPFEYPYMGRREYSYSIGYKDVVLGHKETVRFVAFNTALLSFVHGMPDDTMWIGQKQLKTLIDYGIISCDRERYTIALMHHAERYLHPSEISAYDGRKATISLLGDNVDLILCGHTESETMPKLYSKIGGCDILTAGATYYSDTHRNIFSILCIPSITRETLFMPFICDNGKWIQYNPEKQLPPYRQFSDLPALGTIKRDCEFCVEAKDQIYKIPIKALSVYNNAKGTPYKANNHQEVTRYLDIDVEKINDRGDIKCDVHAAPKRQSNVSATLELENYVDFLEERRKEGSTPRFYIKDKTGEVYASGENLKIDDHQFDKRIISILQKLRQIEQFYDMVFNCPDEFDIKEDDSEIDVVYDLIQRNCAVKLEKLRGLKSYEQLILAYDNMYDMKNLLKVAEEQSSCWVQFERDFCCNFMGAKLHLGRGAIYAGPYNIDTKDLQFKIDTFSEGDIRHITFRADKEFHCYLFIEGNEHNDYRIIPPEYIITDDKFHLDWGFIFEENNKKDIVLSIESDMFNRATELFRNLDMDIDTATESFYRYILHCKGIPFGYLDKEKFALMKDADRGCNKETSNNTIMESIETIDSQT